MPQFIASFRLPTAILCLVLLAACQTTGRPGLIKSEVTAELTPEAASAIAQDMGGKLAEQIGPGNTTIALRENDTVFGPTLEASLRGRGYAVVTDQATEGAAVEPLAYTIDPFEGGVLVRLSASRIELTRVYTLNGTGATPASPLSVMQRRSAAPS
ncbi:conjugal transfer protein TrbH (plasmid) [Hartmannibacter diazotrophicus]|uniref:Conjugal transfer protein TrbH n=1 Tax=Hartmannibacter diazotrophicus TaxID=1482074 RepID=A0A2C9DE03_9HYPH|nr:conjugal transfer protein TrbH [Hartmannibacter diazotrophicus]SON58483.1 conjugal transfer protein TrbH [Hartmannibacter diazotrophicus]